MGHGAHTGPDAIVVAVGPNPREVERVRDLAASIAAHEPADAIMVLVDDHPEPRNLTADLPRSLQTISLHHRRASRPHFSRSVGICAVILHGLQWIQANTQAQFVLKLDTDSLVIGPYRQRVAERFDRNPGTGMIGAHKTAVDGTRRDWSVHAETLALLTKRFHWRHPRASMRTWNDPLKAHARRLHGAARRHGYQTAEHCMGGGYAIARRALDAMAGEGFLDDPGLWSQADLPEDVMLGLHVRALGFTLADATQAGEVFGVSYKGLAAPPAELLARGYGVIHALKNDPNHGEDEIRAFFHAHRTGVAA